MVKTMFLFLLSFIMISGLLLVVGYTFDFKLMMFRFYKETSNGFEASSSVIPFIIGIFCSYVIGKYYHHKRIVGE